MCCGSHCWPAVAALALVWWLRGRRADDDGGVGRTAEDLDTLTAWEPQATRILTSQERLALGVLMRALPEYMILAQVPLARFLKVPTRHSYAEWLHRVGQLCADLVICDSASQVLAVVEVRSPADKTSERAHKRQVRMRRVLKAAGIPMHVWTENALPSAEEARNAIFPPKPAPAVIGSPEVRPAGAALAAAGVAAPAGSTAAPRRDMEQPELSPEEVVEMRDPPPSTWFDNLESAPIPLRAPDKKPPPR